MQCVSFQIGSEVMACCNLSKWDKQQQLILYSNRQKQFECLHWWNETITLIAFAIHTLIKYSLVSCLCLSPWLRSLVLKFATVCSHLLTMFELITLRSLVLVATIIWASLIISQHSHMPKEYWQNWFMSMLINVSLSLYAKMWCTIFCQKEISVGHAGCYNVFISEYGRT